MNRRKDLQNEFGVKGRSMGIFQIVNIRNGKRYVASSPTLDSAWQREKFMLDTGSHPNSALQHDYKNQAGADFQFELLAKLELGGVEDQGAQNGVLNRGSVLAYRNALKELERKWLDELKPYAPERYNQPPADGGLGRGE